MSLLLLATHLLAFAAGGCFVYFLLPRFLEAREVDGHTVLEIHAPEGDPVKRPISWPAVTALVVGVVLVIAGIQFWIDRGNEQDRLAQDRAYSECLTDWADELVMTIQSRTEAGTRVADAERMRDAAVDELLQVVSRAREIPPRATEADLSDALSAALQARGRLDAEQERYDAVRAENQYVVPRAVCER